MNIVLEPWRVCKTELPNLWDVYLPQRTAPHVKPASMSEADLHYASWKNRELETTPPIVTHYPTGMWAISAFDALYQLRELPLTALRTSEQAYDAIVAKYVRWIEEGHQPPPIRGFEMPDRTIKVMDGHHRLAALRQLNAPCIRVWVSPIGLDVSDLTHEVAVRFALRNGLAVPLKVAREYQSTRAMLLERLRAFRAPLQGI